MKITKISEKPHVKKQQQSRRKSSLDEDSEPALKKARQESPKLSSLLMAGSKKNSKKINPAKTLGYSIPSCTKVMHVKKKNLSVNGNSNTATITPVSLLSQGITSCVSVTNVSNPNQTSINLGSGVTLTSQHNLDNNSLLKNHTSIKPLPSLMKMAEGLKTSKTQQKQWLNFSNTNLGDKNDDFSNSVSTEQMNGFHPEEKNDEVDNLQSQLLKQRIDFEQQEHKIKMKLLEKQLAVQNSQALYWSLKLKLLRSNRDIIDNHDFPINGHFD